MKLYVPVPLLKDASTRDSMVHALVIGMCGPEQAVDVFITRDIGMDEGDVAVGFD